MKVIKEDLENLKPVLETDIDGTVNVSGKIGIIMADAIAASKRNALRTKELLKDANAEIKDKPFTGTEKERETNMPSTDALKAMKLSEAFNAYKSLWEEVSYRLEQTYHAINRPHPGIYDPFNEMGIDHSKYNSASGHGYLGTTISVTDPSKLDFAEKICAEYNIPECPWEQRNTFIPPEDDQEGYYTIHYTLNNPEEKAKFYLYIDAEAPARHLGFKSKAKKKAQEISSKEDEIKIKEPVLVMEELETEEDQLYTHQYVGGNKYRFRTPEETNFNMDKIDVKINIPEFTLTFKIRQGRESEQKEDRWMDSLIKLEGEDESFDRLSDLVKRIITLNVARKLDVDPNRLYNGEGRYINFPKSFDVKLPR